MKNKIDYKEVFKAVEKAVEADAIQLRCSDCGQGFFKIYWVGVDEPDYIFEEGLTYNCSDHILYDLLVNPEATESIMVTGTKKSDRKIGVVLYKADARLFIQDRLN